MPPPSAVTPASFTTFGDLLKHLRLRAQLTQRELALAVGYNHAHLSRLENNQRLPDAATLKALFIPALGLQDEPEWAVRLLELAAEGRGEAPPAAPPRPVPAPAAGAGMSRSRLPVPMTPLLGRESVVAELHEILMRPEVRLLTLAGPPGIGKTRLALHLASELAGQFVDGAAFVDLTSVREAGGMAEAVATALDVKESVGQSLGASLLGALRRKFLLLVLDNFEQAVDAAPLVSDWLQFAPHLKVLVTSRETLRVSGEQEYQVPPLLPPTQLELFTQRARAVQPGYQLTPQSAPIIAEICARLDGLPLAIELAAARSKLFSPQAMFVRLDRRLHWLTGGAREGPAWRQTLRGAIEWSYNLLEAGEQSAFARMAVFAGGCTPEAAEAVTGAPLETLLALADKSLLKLVSHEPEAEPRFIVLETLHEYALERLLERPDDQAAARRAHARHYLALAQSAEAEAAQSHPLGWLDRLDEEHDNLRAALAWSLDHEPETGVQLAMGLGRFWYLRGHFSESRRWQSAALAYAAESQRMVLTRHLGEACWNLGDLAPARAFLEESVRLARAAQDHAALAEALNLFGRVVKDMGAYAEAVRYLEEGLALAREQDHPAALIPLLRNLGNLNIDLGRHADAIRCFEESLELARRQNDRLGIAGALNNVGIVHLALKNYEPAKACLLEALVIFQEDGYQFGSAMAVVNLGRVAHMQGALDEAQRNFETSLRLAREIGKKWSMAYALNNLGLVACDRGHWPTAERCFREALQTALDAQAAPRALDTLEGWARLAAHAGQGERALELLGLVLRHPSSEHEAVERAQSWLAVLRGRLPEEAARAALERGASLDWESTARDLLRG